MKCPKCNEECERDEVHNGIAMLYGPWGCFSCGWSDHPHYDCSEGPSAAEKEMPGWSVGPTGGAIRKRENNGK